MFHARRRIIPVRVSPSGLTPDHVSVLTRVIGSGPIHGAIDLISC